ncbi:MAG: hypothetical protein ISS93_00130 [Candidatus Aenigmarchaeota archaeon]|nr:hypothetical protein [Candidatus Aenigmarchaeota archaeon]
MEQNLKEQEEKKLKEGWIKTSMMIEVLAVTEEAARSSLEEHVKQMEREKKSLIVKKDFKEIRKVDKPLPNLEVGYSNVVALEVLAADFDTLVFIAMNYAPTTIEIFSPDRIQMDAGEAQGILNSVSDLIHKFAQQGLGGVVIRS